MRVPDRWMDYTKVGKKVHNTFIAFKTPLDQRGDLEHTVVDVVKQVPNLGLVIDLTNTNKYYNGDKFRSNNVDYIKIRCPGQMVPPEEVYEDFRHYVRKFLNDEKNDDLIIGVHCTHGVNRTGYLIAKYLIKEKRYKPEDAVEYVAKCRGHKIEREAYEADLKLMGNLRDRD